MSNISNNPNIGLGFAGNPKENSGFRSIDFLNPDFDAVIGEVDYYPADKSPFYSIRIENDAVIFKKIGNVLGRDGSTLRNFVVAIRIPKGFKLAGNTSAKRPLDDLFNQFASEMLEKNMSGENVYKKTLPQDGDNLRKALAGYTLLPVKDNQAVHRPMAPLPASPDNLVEQSACIKLSENEIEKLLADVHYIEFAPYAEIVVSPSGFGPRAKYKANLTGKIAFPRQDKWTVKMGDVIVAKGLTTDELSTKMLTVTLDMFGHKAPYYYYFDPIVTTKGASLDEKKEKLTFAVSALKPSMDYVHLEANIPKPDIKPKVMSIRVDIDGSDNENEDLKKLILTIQGKDFRLIDNGLLELRGDDIKFLDEIKGENFTASLNGKKLKVHYLQQNNSIKLQVVKPSIPTPRSSVVAWQALSALLFVALAALFYFDHFHDKKGIGSNNADVAATDWNASTDSIADSDAINIENLNAQIEALKQDTARLHKNVAELSQKLEPAQSAETTAKTFSISGNTLTLTGAKSTELSGNKIEIKFADMKTVTYYTKTAYEEEKKGLEDKIQELERELKNAKNAGDPKNGSSSGGGGNSAEAGEGNPASNDTTKQGK